MLESIDKPPPGYAGVASVRYTARIDTTKLFARLTRAAECEPASDHDHMLMHTDFVSR